jgi:hypothetical protein
VAPTGRAWHASYDDPGSDLSRSTYAATT